MVKRKRTNKQRGEELNQLSRLLFDDASSKFYWSIGIEILAGLTGIVASFFINNDGGKYLTAVGGFVLLIWSYLLRLSFDEKYDRAETMRRQSVLVEALNWDIGTSQFNEWRRRVGNKIFNAFKLKPRNDDYYSTKDKFGAKKLLKMTYESCFYTKFLYCRIKDFLIIGIVLSAILIATVFTLLPIDFFSSFALKIAYIVYLLLPIMLSSDLLAWFFKIDRLTKSLNEIEFDLERLDKGKKYDDKDVMRLVSEYNCQVCSGLPIPNLLFNRFHGEIKELWDSK